MIERNKMEERYNSTQEFYLKSKAELETANTIFETNESSIELQTSYHNAASNFACAEIGRIEELWEFGYADTIDIEFLEDAVYVNGSGKQSRKLWKKGERTDDAYIYRLELTPSGKFIYLYFNIRTAGDFTCNKIRHDQVLVHSCPTSCWGTWDKIPKKEIVNKNNML